MHTYTEHTLPPIVATTSQHRDGIRIFNVTTVSGPARVTDRFDGHYSIEHGGRQWQTTTPPPGLFGGA